MSTKQHMIDFLRKHRACENGVDWACDNCESMTHVWDTAKPEWLIWLATRKGVLTDRELHEFALWFSQQVEHLMTDERSRNALRVKRLWLDGKATNEELSVAARAAFSAAYYTNRVTNAAAYAADSSARAAHAAARAAFSAAHASACASAYDHTACHYAANAEQAAWLRANTTPNFNL